MRPIAVVLKHEKWLAFIGEPCLARVHADGHRAAAGSEAAVATFAQSDVTERSPRHAMNVVFWRVGVGAGAR